MKNITALTLAALMGTTAAPALAQSQGDMPSASACTACRAEGQQRRSRERAVPIDVEESIRPTITFEYFVADNVGIELLASWPFEHDIKSRGAKIAEVKHLPPTLSLQYHFTNKSGDALRRRGHQLHLFLRRDRKGRSRGRPNLDLDDSWGLALHAGWITPSARKARCAPMCAGSTSRAT